MIDIPYDSYKSTNLHQEILQKTLLSTIEYDRDSLLLTIVNLVFKMYRNGMLSAETEVRNGIVAAMHASR